MMMWYYRDLENWINNGCDKDVAKQVITLDISCKKLENIPKEISYLIQLQKLSCVQNEIREIPIEICYLTQLKGFYCSRNNIKEIPKEIKYLIRL